MIPRSPSEIEIDAAKLRQKVDSGEIDTTQGIRILGAYVEELAAQLSHTQKELETIKSRS